MRLKRLKVQRATTCGGLLDGIDIWLGRTEAEANNDPLEPLCLLGPNGSGKSQFLQLIAEIFQAAWHEHSPEEERDSANSDAIFELEYVIKPEPKSAYCLVRLSRAAKGKSVGPMELHIRKSDEWVASKPGTAEFGYHLPSIVIGYTSGDNETMSLPFFISRAGYAKDVRESALASEGTEKTPFNNRTMLIDYGTNLEVLFANLTMNDPNTRKAIVDHARIEDIASCRCVIQLAHTAAPNRRAAARKDGGRKGIQLTEELENILRDLKRSATCWHVDEKAETYTFDYFVDDATRDALAHFFDDAFELYRSLHKFALLNDLVIPKSARDRILRSVQDRRFATRLPEPLQDDMVFSFKEVQFYPYEGQLDQTPVDYVALSDGEHQQALILSLFAMIREHNALFLMDEPESHFNPQWRVKFVKRLLGLPVERGNQDVLLTSHAPFLPADISREQVLIFKRQDEKIEVRQPEIETYGANFDSILEHCFEVRPPISQRPRDEIDELLKSEDIELLSEAMEKLGSSVEKTFVADRLRTLKAKPKQ